MGGRAPPREGSAVAGAQPPRRALVRAWRFAARPKPNACRAGARGAGRGRFVQTTHPTAEAGTRGKRKETYGKPLWFASITALTERRMPDLA